MCGGSLYGSVYRDKKEGGRRKRRQDGGKIEERDKEDKRGSEKVGGRHMEDSEQDNIIRTAVSRR